MHALIARWQDAVDEMEDKRRLPHRLIIDRYRFIEERRDIVEAALASIAGAGEVEERDDATTVIDFLEHDTLIGVAVVTPVGELRLECDPLHADALRKNVEETCRGHLTAHRRSEVDLLDKLIDDAVFVPADDIDDGGCP